MRVLVAYASEHGSTTTIAERIGSALKNRGLRAEVVPADAVSPAERYDAFVIGSAVHNQLWLTPAMDFVRGRAEELAAHPVWLFSVGMPAALRRPLKRFAYTEEPKLLAQFDEGIEPVAHRLLSGVIAPEHLSLFGRLAFRAIGGRYGDYRDWAEVDAWAADIADALKAPEAGS